MPVHSEHNENKEVRPSVVEMAKKKRHIHLLEKLQRGKTLSRAETNEIEKFERGSVPPGYVTTQEEVAEAFGVDPRTVRRWAIKGMPRDAHGYNILKIDKWRQRKDDGSEEDMNQKAIKEATNVGIRHGIDLMKTAIQGASEIISKHLRNHAPKDFKEILNFEIEFLVMKLLKKASLDPLIDEANKDSVNDELDENPE